MKDTFSAKWFNLKYVVAIELVNTPDSLWIHGPYKDLAAAQQGRDALLQELKKRKYEVDSYTIVPLHHPTIPFDYDNGDQANG